MKRILSETNRSLILIFFIILIVPALFYQTTLAMADVWWVNETFTHGFLIFPITLWLIWEKRKNLSRLSPAPEPLLLILSLLFSCLWLVSALIDVKVVMQISMISIILTLVWAFLGRKIFFYLLFPFLFLYFAVPLGQGLIPILMDFTANTTVFLVRQTGIPIYQDGLNFILPSGSWSVAEECSGVRYLIATLTLGVVYSYLNYATLPKRLAFIAFSIIVPILANSLRAFIIVMLGHFSGMKIAVGADHLVYGWLLFGIIIFAMFYIGSFWRDNNSEFDKKFPASDTHPIKPRTTAYLVVSLIAISTLQLLFYQLQSQVINTTQIASSLSKTERYGSWQRQSDATPIWQPILHHPDLTLSDIYASSEDEVQLDAGYYYAQREGSETVTSNNKLVNPYGGDWKVVSSSVINKEPFSIQETTISNSNRKLLVWQWYRMGDAETYNPYKAKMYEAYMRLFSGRMDGAFITLSTPLNEDIESARIRLLSFFNQSNHDINQLLDDLQRAYAEK